MRSSAILAAARAEQRRPAITRAEARLIAEEVVKLMRGTEPPDEYLTTRQAAQYLGCSVGWIYHNIDKLPHEALAGRRKKMFSKRRLAEWVSSRQ